ncbi:MAG TPA: YidC/Oxa1 family membrane protein insertase [Patescibacteria group bacterium]|nr:YidC/Oxa1 family membrane protein insertase [Patescibacteria group bacterium]
MIELFNTVLYEPIYNFLIFLYNTVPGNDIGLAIIVLTVCIKLVLLPLSWQAVKSQKVMQELQPKLEKIKKQYKDDKEKIAAETMKLYRDQKVNPLSSCLPLLLQFPFLIAVYQAFRVGLTTENFDLLYPFVQNPGHIDTLAFGIIDMAVPSLALAILAGAGQYLQTQMLSSKKPKMKSKGAKDESVMANMNKSMQYFMPFMTILIGMSLPAGLTFYWFLTTILTTLQQKLVFKKTKNSDDKAEVIPPKNNTDKNNKKESENIKQKPSKEKEQKQISGK